MSGLSLKGDSSGQIVLAVPNVAGNTTLTLQANTGTVALLTDSFGVGQTWTSFTIGPSGRQAGTTYTNTSGKTIAVSIFSTFAYSNALSLEVDGIEVAYKIESYVNALRNNVFAIVPNGSTYKLVGPTPTFWRELR